MSPPPIYMDYNATTPLDERVVTKIAHSAIHLWGNPSSSHKYGLKAKTAIQDARKHIAKMINAVDTEVIFTSGGTEANNIVVYNIIPYFETWTKSWNEGSLPHVITSAVEHPSVLLPLQRLESSGKIELTIVPLVNCALGKDAVLERIKPTTCLVSIMLANNETGVIMPIEDIGRELHKINERRAKSGDIKILFHTDAAQAIGKIAVDAKKLHVHLMSIAGHKFYGPRIGCLFVNEAIPVSVSPVFLGGGQENGIRPGTENTPMIVGLGEAARIVTDDFHEHYRHLLDIRKYLEQSLTGAFGEDVEINCKDIERLPNTSNISIKIKGCRGSDVLANCKRLIASCGAACHQLDKPSGVLLASGIAPDIAVGAIRLSIGRETTYEEVEAVVQDLLNAAKHITAKI